jgi:Sec1 family
MFRFTSNGIVAPDPNHPYSLRTTRASWANRRIPKSGAKINKEKNVNEENDLRRNGSRVILFSLGGMTYSEMRSAYEITRDDKREIIFGTIFLIKDPLMCTRLLSSLKFLSASMHQMHSPSAQRYSVKKLPPHKTHFLLQQISMPNLQKRKDCFPRRSSPNRCLSSTRLSIS